MDGKFNMSADKKCLFVHDTLVTRQFDTVVKVDRWYQRTPRRFNAKAEWRIFVFDSTNVTFPVHRCHLSQFGNLDYNRS